MGKTRNKNPRNVALLSGRPLSETIEPSSAMITNFQEEWVTSKDLTEPGLPYVPQVMDSLTVFMLGNININSTHLFRADILHDSLGILKTPQQKEQKFAESGNNKAALSADIPEAVEPLPAREIVGFELTRTVVRRLIPRNPKVDFPIEQTCHFYKGDKSIPVTPSNDASGDAPTNTTISRYLVVYSPHIKSKAENPFYHPLIQGLAYLYDYDPSSSNSTEESTGSGTLSLHFVLYPDEPVQTRLERTLHILINNHIRLARNTRLSEAPEADGYNHNKDNIVPRHQAQDTYLRLKFKYAPDLCERWVEKTDPSKHVFEDLAITAFLIELWRNMYGVVPIDERDENTQEHGDPNFPGFVDVACGNGLLVYVLLMEGYQGWGFDARRRKTWSIFPEHVQARLKEEIYIPKPFVDEMMASGAENELQNLGVKYHSGMFPEDTFIISNHADELTPWTPLMAALANPASPLPFIAIPCCSHSLSGAKYRYPPPKKASVDKHDNTEEGEIEQNPQPASGDLRALRLAKHEAQTEAGFYKSMYGALTTKTMSITEDIGCEVEKTLLRIPSTRNMGVIGGRKATTEKWRQKTQNPESSMHPTDVDNEETIDRIVEVVHRECYREGGISTAARIWIERAKGLHQGQGKGKESGH